MGNKFVDHKLDITGWKKVVEELSKISGKTFAEVLKAETAEILSITANRKAVKQADKSKLVGRHMSVNTYFLGFSGKKKAYTVKVGEADLDRQTTYYLHHRLPNKIWNYIFPKMQKRTKYHFW